MFTLDRIETNVPVHQLPSTILYLDSEPRRFEDFDVPELSRRVVWTAGL